MDSSLDDNIPQWKKDLILRKRAQSKCPAMSTTGAVQLSCTGTTATTAGSSAIGTVVGCKRGTSAVTDADKQFEFSQTQTSSVGIGNALTLNTLQHVAERCDATGETTNNQSVITTAANSNRQSVDNNVKMVQDSVLVMHPPLTQSITNGDCCKRPGDDSDSSEELQYGPGIVSKLKSKYLSLTLRETIVKPRPSILHMRRATSLENMLDAADSADELSSTEHNLNNGSGGDTDRAPSGRRATVSTGTSNNHARRYTPRTTERNGNVRNTQTRYRNTARGNDSVKRARSVETLLRPPAGTSSSRESLNEDVVIVVAKEGNDNNAVTTNRKRPDKNNVIIMTDVVKPSCNGTQRLNRPKRIAPIMDETERPPADLVKQTLMLFEGPPTRRTKAPRPTGDVAAKVANFKHIIQQEKNTNNNSNTGNNNNKKPVSKPVITPKPVLSDKNRKTFRPASPKRPLTPNSSLDGARSPDIRLDSPLSPVPLSPGPPLSPDPVSRPSPIPDVSRIAETCDNTSTASSKQRPKLSETPDLIVHSSPITPRTQSPVSVKNITAEFLIAEVKSSGILKSDKRTKSPSPVPVHHPEVVDAPAKEIQKIISPIRETPAKTLEKEKEITKQAVENISNASLSVTYSFSDNVTKSHLPRLNTIPVRINRLVADTPSTKAPVIKPRVPEINGVTTETKPVPIVKDYQRPPPPPIPTNPPPIVSSASVHHQKVKEVTKTVTARPPTPVQTKTLTSREIEKNSINKLKTLEQPVSKVVVSMRNLDDVVANKNLTGVLGKHTGKQSRNQEQTTILFNFQTRDTIPDYIATDGTNVRRGKREKPKAGESGIILLPGAPTDEFTDEDEDWMLSLNGPPSPCDVYFENDNILIDGKSSIVKHPKRQKMRIQFDDDATQVFEYLSEAASLMEDTRAITPPVSSPTATSPSSSNTGGHTVPSLSGCSSLASYTPSKISVSADFQLGVTRSMQPVVTPPCLASTATLQPAQSSSNECDSLLELQESSDPITYSAETNADILF